MKKRITALFLTVAILMLALTSCGLFSALTERTVTYDFGAAGDDVEITVSLNSTAPELAAPEYNGHRFIGWYTDRSYSTTYDFRAPVTDDITLYARFEAITDESGSPLDYEELINTVTLEGVRATVMLSVEKFNLGGMLGTTKLNVTQATGSGVIFAESGGYYYCLTNNHVVSTDKAGREIKLFDYCTRAYSGELVCEDADYDLAVVRFKKNFSDELKVLDFNDDVLAIGEKVIAIGSPGGQQNAVTIGEVLKYAKANITGADESVSNITFSVLWHSAPMNSGSSGGVLVDTALRIVGINYAAASSEGKFAYGLTVPAEKVREFLEENGIRL